MVVVGFVAVGGFAGLVSGSHIHSSRVFTGPGSICRHSTGPAGAIAALTSIGVFERFVLPAGIGVGGEAPDSGDLFVHVSGRGVFPFVDW